MAWEARQWARPFGKRLVATVDWVDPNTTPVPDVPTYRWQVLYVGTGLEMASGTSSSVQAAQGAAERFLSELIASVEAVDGR